MRYKQHKGMIQPYICNTEKPPLIVKMLALKLLPFHQVTHVAKEYGYSIKNILEVYHY